VKKLSGIAARKRIDVSGRTEGTDGRTIAFVGGEIMTMDPEGGRAEALVIVGGRIAEVGDRNILEAYPEAEICDLKGQALLPGFNDSHNHLSFGCYLPHWADLGGLTSKNEVLETISKQAACRDSGWVVGFPWTEARRGEANMTREDLDRACPDRPVVLIHGTFHMLLLNSKALELSGFDGPDRKTDAGIARGPDGRATGIILESAGVPVLEMALRTSTAEYADLIEQRSRALLSFGITAVQDPGVTPEADRAYRLLHEQGRLPVSVLMMPHGRAILDNDLCQCLNGPVTGTGDEMLRVGPVKLFADGGVYGSIANAGVINGKPFSSGLPRDDFSSPLAEAIKRGFRVCVHSIGNMATDAVLDAYEAAVKEAPAGSDLRPRIEHMFTMSDRQIERLAALGGCASVQPFFLARIGDSRRFCFEGFKWFPFGDLMRSGIILCANSDDPGFGSFGQIDPVKGSLIGAAMGDSGSPYYYPEQALPFEQWLWMYTAGGAYAGGLENERGKLKKGLVADMVVLSSIDPKDAPVVNETWKAGIRVYVREGK
jgi:predicted amidohydrolase YtcJ